MVPLISMSRKSFWWSMKGTNHVQLLSKPILCPNRYLEAAKAGDHLVIDSECLKVGRILASAMVDIKNQNGLLICQGRQTKHL